MVKHWGVVLVWMLVCGGVVSAQEGDAAKSKVELGSRTAKAGFQNEDEIRDKFNNWKTDADARAWLESMKHSVADVASVSAMKPHGEKADVEVTVKSKSGERVERISIKLVSSPNGFNQIDKRWLKTYAAMWKMPPDVAEALKLFVGETPPRESSRDKRRMYLNELDQKSQTAVVDFFTANKAEIVSDLLAGDGLHASDWMIVTYKGGDKPKWVIRSSADAIKFYSDGPVELTRSGNLKIGRITMQRKGGDNGRDTAKMLQFKINPVQLFDAK
ncbi:MAG: type II restriction endonuclease [Candidatus Saccharimonas sp.]|nr:type II restriction endonuclease [Planctomycetaceae bacterium]